MVGQDISIARFIRWRDEADVIGLANLLQRVSKVWGDPLALHPEVRELSELYT